MKYKILTVTVIDDFIKAMSSLEDQVNCAIGFGWIPQGGISVSQGYGNNFLIYSQAMVKNEVQEEMPGKTLNLDTK